MHGARRSVRRGRDEARWCMPSARASSSPGSRGPGAALAHPPELETRSDAARARERFEHASRVDTAVRQQEGFLLAPSRQRDIWCPARRPSTLGREPTAARRAFVTRALAPRDTRTACFLVDGYEWLASGARAVWRRRRQGRDRRRVRPGSLGPGSRGLPADRRDARRSSAPSDPCATALSPGSRTRLVAGAVGRRVLAALGQLFVERGPVSVRRASRGAPHWRSRNGRRHQVGDVAAQLVQTCGRSSNRVDSMMLAAGVGVLGRRRQARSKPLPSEPEAVPVCRKP